MRLCTCGHDRQAHRYQRKGTACGECACNWWRRRWPWRPVARVLLQVGAGVAAFAVAVTAGAYAVHGLVLVIRAIP